jgi:hypothetical protein
MWSTNLPEQSEYLNNSPPCVPALRADGMKRQMTKAIILIANSYRSHRKILSQYFS